MKTDQDNFEYNDISRMWNLNPINFTEKENAEFFDFLKEKMKTSKDCIILIGEDEEVEEEEEIHQNLNIPTEIFIEIFSFLDYNTLGVVNRSCKLFYRITVFYKTTFPASITRIREMKEKVRRLKGRRIINRCSHPSLFLNVKEIAVIGLMIFVVFVLFSYLFIGACTVWISEK